MQGRAGVEPAEAQGLLGRRAAAPRHFAARGALYLVAVELDDGCATGPTLGAVATVVALVGAAAVVGAGYVGVVGLYLVRSLQRRRIT